MTTYGRLRDGLWLKATLVVSTLILPNPAQAGETSLIGYVGAAAIGYTTGNLVVPTNGQIGSFGAVNHENVGPTFGVDLTYQPEAGFGIAVVLDVTPYNNPSGSPDMLYSAYVMPRLQTGGTLHWWLGVGVGGVVSKFGSFPQFSDGFTPNSDTSFAFTGRLGVDEHLSNSFIIGCQVVYNVTYELLGQNAQGLNYDLKRLWGGLSIRLGMSF